MVWYSELAASVQDRIRDLDLTSILEGDARIQITSRPKTIDTLREKLARDRGMALPSIQDIAGVRVDAQMTLRQQSAIAELIARQFEHDPAAAVKDLREGSHSGYRAMHVWLRLEGRVEVQVRTVFQSEWANVYEALGDLLGRHIRYGGLPGDPGDADYVRELQDLSTRTLAELESRFDHLAHDATEGAWAPLRVDESVPSTLRDAIPEGASNAQFVRSLEAEFERMLKQVRYSLQQRAGKEA
jgi:ppGpp synthetase/RelA/SpoT-type nucleotidyltranferase